MTDEQRGDRLPAQLMDVEFPVAVRGYDRHAVDDYVARVERLLAQRHEVASPQAAVKQALERVGEQTTAILQQAQEAADDITASARADVEAETRQARDDAAQTTARARAEAEATVARAHEEADDLIARARAEADRIIARSRTDAAERVQDSEAEAAALVDQLRELRADTDDIWEERRDLLEDLRALASRLGDEATEAIARFPPPEAASRSAVDAGDPRELPPGDRDG